MTLPLDGHRPKFANYEDLKKRGFWSEDIKKKIYNDKFRMSVSLAMKGNKNARSGWHHSDETKKKMSELKIGKPSGRKGMKVSPETIIKMSAAMKGRRVNLGTHWSQESRMKIVGRMPPNANNARSRAGWYDLGDGNNMYFRSSWEVNYAIYLNFLVKQKQINSWSYEKDVFVFEKIKFGTRSYRPDFKIFNKDGTFEYHEVKGWMDNKSKTKLNRMRIYYPDTKIVLIDSDYYKDLKRKVGVMLKFY